MNQENDLDELLDDDLDLQLLNKVEYEQIKTPDKPSTVHHHVETANLATYVYPTNLQVRDYQYNIVYRAIFDNILVALPTGLGKTFIASTVMLNFLRWFPQLKIIFMAPTKPLVAQQIKACCGITGIPQSKVAILLDKTRKNRAAIWDEKQVFFTTPQVVENDLARGIVNPKHIVLLVIDEAHRAKGNYAYNNVVKFLNRFNPSYRILALTATPASDVEGVQEIVDNLCISKVEVRTEKSIDIFKYLKRKEIERISVGQSPEIIEAIEMICVAIAPVLETANQRKIYEVTDPAKINAFSALDAQQKLIRNPNIPEGLKWANYFILQLLLVVGQCLRRLNIYGIRSFYNYFHEKFTEFSTKYNNKKSTNHLAAKFYFHRSIKELLQKCENHIKDPSFLGHQKLDVVISELSSFFQTQQNSDSRVIVFTEFRESALDIVRALERQGPHLKPHIFIGQAKEKEKFDEVKFLKKGKKSKKKESEETPKSKENTSRPSSSSERAQMSGMNQKMQKELIKNFKKGDYNILVATSIGEEGLDIGEVDLIVCYDSTSSPIKNVQRMGRTGRNRDGKVILLFSSNEELKFDKAMGGYEYIQQHIMNGNMINLHERNSLFPREFKPIADEQYIEIPEENEIIKAEEDEDEIIKIATKYMTQKDPGKKTKKASNAKTLKKSTKTTKSGSVQPPKQFFMPDNATQGFTPVSAMLKRKGESESLRDKKIRVENELSMVQSRDVLNMILDSDDEQDFEKLCTEEITTAKAIASAETEIKKETENVTPLLSKLHNFNEPVSKESALSLAECFDRDNTIDRKQPDILEELYKVRERETSKAEEFDDDDDEILALAHNSSAFVEANDQTESEQINPTAEVLFPSNFEPEDGFLTESENQELYMCYFVPTNTTSLFNCYNPSTVAQKGGRVGHGRVSQWLLQSQHSMRHNSTEDWSEKVEEFKKCLPPLPLSENFIKF